MLSHVVLYNTHISTREWHHIDSYFPMLQTSGGVGKLLIFLLQSQTLSPTTQI